MSQDPDGFNVGDSNLYRYVNNSPMDGVDPSGKFPVYEPEVPSGDPVQMAALAASKKATGVPAVPTLDVVGGNEYGIWVINQINRFGILDPYESDVKIRFFPNPKTVNSSEIAFVQIARWVSLETGRPVPFPGKSRYETRTGWSLDRLKGRKVAWYGYADDGTPMKPLLSVGLNSTNVTPVIPGSSPRPYRVAVLHDIPSYNQRNKAGDVVIDARALDISWQFETYAFAKAGPQKGLCYGGISWGFNADKNAQLISTKRRFLVDADSPAFRVSVEKWNDVAKATNEVDELAF